MSILATELVFWILHYADPRDIVRWRTVSKWFHAITCDPALWKSLYKTSPFPRPPGPFPTEPITSLERTLVKAAQLAQSWTTRPLRAVSTTTIKVGKPRTPPRLIAGRWLVVYESARRFVLHDLDPRADTHTRQVLWELDESIVSAWDVISVVSVEGQRIVYVLLQLSDSPPKWKLLEFRLNGDTGELYDSAAVDPPQADSRLHTARLGAGDSQFIFIPATPNGWVYDSRTRVFYKVPSFYEELDPFAYPDQMVIQDTLFVSLRRRIRTYWTIIHVFTLPPDDAPSENGQRVLCLTHKLGRITGNFVRVKAMKPSIDPATGATKMRIIDDYSRNKLWLRCIDLTLPKRSTVEVLPITVDVHHIDLPRERVRANRYVKSCQYIDVSDDGHIRGFYRGKMRQRRKARPWDIIENQHILKFAIDTTQDPSAITRGQIAPPERSHEDDPEVDNTGMQIVFDGMRGKLCYYHPDVVDQVVVVDIE